MFEPLIRSLRVATLSTHNMTLVYNDIYRNITEIVRYSGIISLFEYRKTYVEQFERSFVYTRNVKQSLITNHYVERTVYQIAFYFLTTTSII